MRGVCAAALSLALAAAPAAAQVPDPIGTWSCSMEVYESGTIGAPEVFNISLYRDGTWQLAGRSPDGEVYQGDGTWRLGRARGADGTFVTVEGRTQKPDALPEPFGFTVDLISETAMARSETRYRVTTSVDCGR